MTLLRVLAAGMMVAATMAAGDVSAAEPIKEFRIGLLGDGYPGLFPVADAQALADLLHRCESEPGFLTNLRHLTNQLAPQFHPDAERAALARLIISLVSST